MCLSGRSLCRPKWKLLTDYHPTLERTEIGKRLSCLYTSVWLDVLRALGNFLSPEMLKCLTRKDKTKASKTLIVVRHIDVTRDDVSEINLTY